jgi:hypothetical protein
LAKKNFRSPSGHPEKTNFWFLNSFVRVTRKRKRRISFALGHRQIKLLICISRPFRGFKNTLKSKSGERRHKPPARVFVVVIAVIVAGAHIFIGLSGTKPNAGAI